MSWIVGRKPIVAYLQRFIDCYSWQSVRIWVKKYGLPLRHLPNGKPYVIPLECEEYFRGREG